jgi:hypothetical protein
VDDDCCCEEGAAVVVGEEGGGEEEGGLPVVEFDWLAIPVVAANMDEFKEEIDGTEDVLVMMEEGVRCNISFSKNDNPLPSAELLDDDKDWFVLLFVFALKRLSSDVIKEFLLLLSDIPLFMLLSPLPIPSPLLTLAPAIVPLPIPSLPLLMAALLEILLLLLVLLAPPLSTLFLILGFWSLLITLFPISLHTPETNGSPQAFFNAVDGNEVSSDGVVGIREVVPFIELSKAFCGFDKTSFIEFVTVFLSVFKRCVELFAMSFNWRSDNILLNDGINAELEGFVFEFSDCCDGDGEGELGNVDAGGADDCDKEEEEDDSGGCGGGEDGFMVVVVVDESKDAGEIILKDWIILFVSEIEFG